MIAHHQQDCEGAKSLQINSETGTLGACPRLIQGMAHWLRFLRGLGLVLGVTVLNSRQTTNHHANPVRSSPGIPLILRCEPGYIAIRYRADLLWFSRGLSRTLFNNMVAWLR